jgi:hypothetical protein
MDVRCGQFSDVRTGGYVELLAVRSRLSRPALDKLSIFNSLPEPPLQCADTRSK